MTHTVTFVSRRTPNALQCSPVIPNAKADSHDRAAAVLLLRLCVEHFALGTEAIRLGHQAVNLLTSLQYRFNGLVQYNLRLVELLLDLCECRSVLAQTSRLESYLRLTFMILSAACGSWYFTIYSFNGANGTSALLFTHAVRGYRARNSSKILLSS